MIDDALLKLLRSVDTPSVCNAIEVAQGQRGFNGFTRGTMLASAPTEVMAGYAVTAKIKALAPPDEPAGPELADVDAEAEPVPAVQDGEAEIAVLSFGFRNITFDLIIEVKQVIGALALDHCIIEGRENP